MSNQIKGRTELSILVNHFYAAVRKNELLGPIFNGMIPSEKWPAHLSKLTDFWETVLFGAANFKGNPTLKHTLVDNKLNHGMSQVHFGKWLELWFSSIDELYPDCPVGRKAKDASRNMATGQFMAVWNQRPENAK